LRLYLGLWLLLLLQGRQEICSGRGGCRGVLLCELASRLPIYVRAIRVMLAKRGIDGVEFVAHLVYLFVQSPTLFLRSTTVLSFLM
jgi:hypothetical protein